MLSLAELNPTIIQQLLKDELGISRKKIQTALKNLVDDKKIKRIGSDRKGSWEAYKRKIRNILKTT